MMMGLGTSSMSVGKNMGGERDGTTSLPFCVSVVNPMLPWVCWMGIVTGGLNLSICGQEESAQVVV